MIATFYCFFFVVELQPGGALVPTFDHKYINIKNIFIFTATASAVASMAGCSRCRWSLLFYIFFPFDKRTIWVLNSTHSWQCECTYELKIASVIMEVCELRHSIGVNLSGAQQKNAMTIRLQCADAATKPKEIHLYSSVIYILFKSEKYFSCSKYIHILKEESVCRYFFIS